MKSVSAPNKQSIAAQNLRAQKREQHENPPPANNPQSTPAEAEWTLKLDKPLIRVFKPLKPN